MSALGLFLICLEEEVEPIPSILLPADLHFISPNTLRRNSPIVFPEFSTGRAAAGNNLKIRLSGGNKNPALSHMILIILFNV